MRGLRSLHAYGLKRSERAIHSLPLGLQTQASCYGMRVIAAWSTEGA